MNQKIHYDLSKRILMIILIFTCAVFGVFLCVVGFTPHDGVDLIQTSNNTVDYSVKLKPNSFFEKDTLQASLEGKSDLEKARIIAEYNRRKMKKKK